MPAVMTPATRAPREMRNGVNTPALLATIMRYGSRPPCYFSAPDRQRGYNEPLLVRALRKRICHES
jgi:hypothetical protein